LTSGFLTSAGNFTFNANGNLWTLDVNGNFNSPYSVGITTAGIKWPDGTFQNTAASPVYVTQASYTAANNAGSFANGAFLLANTTNTLATNAGSFANGAFVQANNALVYATNAGSFANGAFLEANIAYTAATAGVIPIYNQANSAYSLAVGAFTKANTGSTPRVIVISDGTSVTMNGDTTDIATQTNTQVAGTLTINTITGTPYSGQKIIFRLQSANTQTFSWDTSFAGSTDLPLPTTSTGSNKYDYVGFIYNSTATKWQLLAKNFGF
jgi:hypothetical protein